MINDLIKNETFREPVYGNSPTELDPFVFIGLYILIPGKKKEVFLSFKWPYLYWLTFVIPRTGQLSEYRSITINM